MRREVRTAARLVLFDSQRRILLFLHTDKRGRKFWATPGGGVGEGESLEQAARREAAEELGAKDVELRPLWTGQSNFMFQDRNVSQTETFFLVSRHSAILGPEVEALHRAEGILRVRWWRLAELQSSKEPIYPVDLVDRIREFSQPA